MPPRRRSKPRSTAHAALGQAIELRMAERKGKGMTKWTVSRDSGLDEKQLGVLIRGTGNPTFTTLLRLAEGLHMRLGDLLRSADRLREDSYRP